MGGEGWGGGGREGELWEGRGRWPLRLVDYDSIAQYLQTRPGSELTASVIAAASESNEGGCPSPR